MVKALHPLGLIAARLELPREVQVPLEPERQDAAPELSASELAASAKAALEQPLDYPPLAAGVVPGDQLAIAIDPAVPAAAEVLRGVVAAAEAAGIEPTAISIVSSDEEFAKSLRDEMPAAVRVVIHDPDDEQNLALVALNEKNERLLISRSIFEADIVLPISCARLPDVAGSGIYEGLYPELSDAETIARLRTPSQRGTVIELAESQIQADEAGWLLGVSLVMQVVPGTAGGVAEVLAGEPAAVFDRSQERCESLWSYTAAQKAMLVIANITGGPTEQTWENVGRSLAAIEPLVAEGGAVAICSDLEAGPGRAVGQLIGRSDYAELEKNFRNDHSDDSWTAWLLARALQRGPVYFLSRLAAADVEELGLAPIADLDELERLACRQESCLVLDGAQFTQVTVAEAI